MSDKWFVGIVSFVGLLVITFVGFGIYYEIRQDHREKNLERKRISDILNKRYDEDERFMKNVKNTETSFKNLSDNLFQKCEILEQEIKKGLK